MKLRISALFAFAPAALGLALAAPAQNVLVVPPGADQAEQNSLSAPQPISGINALQGTGSVARTQWVYDSSNFAGVFTPMLITKLRFRANGANASWSGATIPNLVCDMSTAPADHLNTVATFDQNHGPDRTTIWNNPVTVQAGTSTAATTGSTPGGTWVAEIDLLFGGTPFLYYPALGDLCVDFMTAGVTGTVAQQIPNWDLLTTGAQARRVLNNNNTQFATTGALATSALVMEITWTNYNGIVPAFAATPRTGSSPLQVQFTDQSYSPFGITSWAWDFQDDGIVDSTLQNPVFTFPCGSWNVRLTVGDGVNPTGIVVRPAFIVTDTVTPSFTWQSTAAGAVQFTDTTTPAATSWAWDFDGDNVVDSTLQNPLWSASGCNVSDVTLTASRNCGPSASTSQRVVTAPSLETTFAGGSGGATNWANLFDLAVTNPLGIEICGLDLRTNTGAGTAFAVDVYLCPITSLGNESNSVVWRRVAQGTGVSAGNSSIGNVRSFVQLSNGIYLAPGSYGVMIHHVSGSGQTYTSTGVTTFGNADVALSNPQVRGGLFSGTLFTPRIWNGAIYYATCNTSGEASYGWFENGCAGNFGVPGNRASADPRLGTTMTVTVDGLAQNLAIMILGVSNTNSPLGALPIDLTAAGAPGCLLHVANNATALLLGGGNQATWSLNVPNQPNLVCTRFFTQALSLDPGVNALGAVFSDAAAGVIGQ